MGVRCLLGVCSTLQGLVAALLLCSGCFVVVTGLFGISRLGVFFSQVIRFVISMLADCDWFSLYVFVLYDSVCGFCVVVGGLNGVSFMRMVVLCCGFVWLCAFLLWIYTIL